MSDNEPVTNEPGDQAVVDTPVQEPAAPPAVAQKTEAAETDHMIPKSRFDEVNQQLKKLKAAAEKSAKAQKKAEETAAAEQGKFKELWEQAQAETAAAEAKVKAMQLAEMRRTVAQAVGLPDGLAERLQGETADELTADAEKLLASLPAKPSTVPSTDGGAGKTSKAGSNMTAAEVRALAARLNVQPQFLAEQYGIKLTN